MIKQLKDTINFEKSSYINITYKKSGIIYILNTKKKVQNLYIIHTKKKSATYISI